jgi:hypothetical protein
MRDARRDEAIRVFQELAACKKLVELAANVEVQLRAPEDWTPLLAILSRAQDEAADAMLKLSVAPADRPDVIRALQNAIWRFDTLVRWLTEIIAEGEEAGRKLDAQRADYLRSLVITLDDETRAALGIGETGAPSE